MPKKHSFWNVLDSSNTDIICGNETWLKPSICNSEILPDESDYEIFRKDRKDGFGGVMLAIKSNTNSNPIDITTVTDCDCEIIVRKIECDSNKSLIVISAYTDTDHLIAALNTLTTCQTSFLTFAIRTQNPPSGYEET